MAVEEYERVHAETRSEWRRWLAANHTSSPGVWLFTPRRAKSHWSRSNRERVERLAAAGLMEPAGVAAVEAAKAAGTWET